MQITFFTDRLRDESFCLLPLLNFGVCSLGKSSGPHRNNFFFCYRPVSYDCKTCCWLSELGVLGSCLTGRLDVGYKTFTQKPRVGLSLPIVCHLVKGGCVLRVCHSLSYLL